MQAYERYVERWRGAGVLDESTAAAIRAFESAQERPSGAQWQVVLALILGGILLGAGVLLLVAAHWDDISPGARLGAVVAMVAGFHVAGIVARERFPGFATTMHALGTVACGGAIALVGQIFNMEGHWPGAVMLWAGCAVAGWWALEDEFQQTLALLLVPAWVVSEWSFRASVYSGSDVYVGRVLAAIAAVYLTVFLRSRRRAMAWILFAAAGVALMVTTAMLSDGWMWRFNGYGHDWGFVPVGLRIASYAMMAGTVAAGWWADRRSLLPVGVVTGMAFALPWMETVVRHPDAIWVWTSTEPWVTMYGLVAAVCVFLAWWGLRVASRAMVNYGIAAFALTVMWFYFSDVMGKLDRSLGLIVLGVLFLAGGWGLEMARRRLVAEIAEVAA